MRRTGSDIYAPGATRSLASCGVDVDAVVDALEGLVLEGRAARLREVIDARVASVSVLIDSPHDPHNGAAVVRTLDAFGVQDLHVVEREEPFLVSASVARGAQRWVDVHTHATVDASVAALRGAGYQLVATHPAGELVPADLAGIERLCLVLGNERDGISEAMTRACTRAVRVPMRGFTESLNVSVTAAILLHAAVAGRPGDLPLARRRELLARGLVATVQRSREILAARGVFVPQDAGPTPAAPRGFLRARGRGSGHESSR